MRLGRPRLNHRLPVHSQGWVKPTITPADITHRPPAPLSLPGRTKSTILSVILPSLVCVVFFRGQERFIGLLVVCLVASPRRT